MNKFEAIQNVAFFLLEKTGGVCGKWKGKLTAKEQRTLFGSYLGKGTIYIDGATETVEVVRTVCFGTDYEITFNSSFNELFEKATLREFANIPLSK